MKIDAQTGAPELSLVKPAHPHWLRPQDLEPLWPILKEHASFKLEEISRSAMGYPIYSIVWGEGAQRILAWTQMHGNEATASFAMLDWLEQLWIDPTAKGLDQRVQVCLILMLNPDGAEFYQRRNALGIDLNRDAKAKNSTEIKAFFSLLERFKPHWAFNMHDQRNIFSVGAKDRPASLSFLAPSSNFERTVNTVRKSAMQLCGAIYKRIEDLAPGHFGRYTDVFYPRALGDNLMKAGVPNILFEAGPYYGDENRNLARKLCYKGFCSALELIASEDWRAQDTRDYLMIPENKENLRDLIIRDCSYQGVKVDLALMKTRKVDKSTLQWREYYQVADLGDLKHLKGLQEKTGKEIQSSHYFDLEAPANFKILCEEGELIFENGKLQEH